MTCKSCGKPYNGNNAWCDECEKTFQQFIKGFERILLPNINVSDTMFSIEKQKERI